MPRREGKIHPVQRGILSKPSTTLIPAKAGKVRRFKSGEVRHINPQEYNRTGKGQSVFNQCAHKIGMFAMLGPSYRAKKA